MRTYSDFEFTLRASRPKHVKREEGFWDEIDKIADECYEARLFMDNELVLKVDENKKMKTYAKEIYCIIAYTRKCITEVTQEIAQSIFLKELNDYFSKRENYNCWQRIMTSDALSKITDLSQLDYIGIASVAMFYGIIDPDVIHGVLEITHKIEGEVTDDILKQGANLFTIMRSGVFDDTLKEFEKLEFDGNGIKFETKLAELKDNEVHAICLRAFDSVLRYVNNDGVKNDILKLMNTWGRLSGVLQSTCATIVHKRSAGLEYSLRECVTHAIGLWEPSGADEQRAKSGVINVSMNYALQHAVSRCWTQKKLIVTLREQIEKLIAENEQLKERVDKQAKMIGDSLTKK